ncbi:MAG: diacylglycerol kinase family protein [Cyanobacteria bacterium SIG32]|nr:diacylglycerol kinase family protein [Cyanobacteria bacterium SIG32]
MSKFKSQGFWGTFLNAQKGLRLVLKSEVNIRIHFCAALLILIFAVCLNFSITKICILLLTISGVICAEMVNSALEFSLDAMYKNKYSKLVGMAKDIAAGAVMFTTFIAVVIGFLLFLPPIIDLFR